MYILNSLCVVFFVLSQNLILLQKATLIFGKFFDMFGYLGNTKFLLGLVPAVSLHLKM